MTCAHCKHLLEPTHLVAHKYPRRQIFFPFSPSFVFEGFFLRCHTFLYESLLLSGKIQGCTFTPSPSLRHPLPASSSPSYTSCCGVTDSVTQEKTEGETEGGKGKECESLRGVCKTLRVCECRSTECAATRVNVEYISLISYILDYILSSVFLNLTNRTLWLLSNPDLIS